MGMKRILGYVLLLTGAVFMASPATALIAVSVYLAGIVLTIISIIGLLDKHKPRAKIYSFVIVFGVIMCTFLLADSVGKYATYFTEVDKAGFMNVPQDGNENIVKLPLKGMIVNGLLNLLLSIIIAFIIIKRSHTGWKYAVLICLPLSLLIPVTLFLVKFLAKSGFPVSA